MHQERSATIYIGAQQAHAFVGRVPGLHHDVVQFVAKEVFNDALVMRIDLEEVRENADGRMAALKSTRLEDATDGLGGIPMLGDDGFERTFLAKSCGKFGAQAIEMKLGFGFFETFRFEGLADVGDFGGQALHSLRDMLKFKSKLAALSTEGLNL